MRLYKIRCPPERWEDNDGNEPPAQDRFMETVQEGLDGAERMLVFYVKLTDSTPKRRYVTCLHDISRGPHHRLTELEMLALLQRELNRKLEP